jgi:hypothetical protein
VKVPTGGDGEKSHKPASACRLKFGKVSRFGAMPKPTVTVRMEENGISIDGEAQGVSASAARAP